MSQMPYRSSEMRHAADRRVDEPCLVLIGGRSGCGKTTLVTSLVTKHPALYARVPSFTTRARRPGESDAEYRFVSREALRGMHERGELLSVDDAYGENYAMSRLTIEEVLASGCFGVKAMHAKNHAAVLEAMPRTISVLLELADERWQDERRELDADRPRRFAEDRQYYATLDVARFDIVHRFGIKETPSMTADALHEALQAFVSKRRWGAGV